MFSRIISFLCRLFHYDQLQPDENGQFDPKKLRIKIPKCTFVKCNDCLESYVVEHDKTCPCQLRKKRGCLR